AAVDRAPLLWAIIPPAVDAAQPGGHVASEDRLRLGRGDPDGRLADQVAEVVEVVGGLLEPEAARLALVAHPTVVVAGRVGGDVVDGLHLANPTPHPPDGYLP